MADTALCLILRKYLFIRMQKVYSFISNLRSCHKGVKCFRVKLLQVLNQFHPILNTISLILL